VPDGFKTTTRIQDKTYNVVLMAIYSEPKDDKIDTPCSISDNTIKEATTIHFGLDGLWLSAASVSDPAAACGNASGLLHFELELTSVVRYRMFEPS
jgi:hypothetical protein